MLAGNIHLHCVTVHMALHSIDRLGSDVLHVLDSSRQHLAHSFFHSLALSKPGRRTLGPVSVVQFAVVLISDSDYFPTTEWPVHPLRVKTIGSGKLDYAR